MSGAARLMRFPSAVPRAPGIEAWLDAQPAELGAIARLWFERLRRCGPDVRELMHDGHPTVCVGDAAFAEVNAFTAHVNLGFFLGARMDDPEHLLEGTGRFMRHVKLRPAQAIDGAALERLVERAYRDIKALAREQA